MAEKMIQIREKDFEQLALDVSVIKNILLDEGELTDWAKEELAKARKEDSSDRISLEAIEQKIRKK